MKIRQLMRRWFGPSTAEQQLGIVLEQLGIVLEQLGAMEMRLSAIQQASAKAAKSSALGLDQALRNAQRLEDWSNSIEAELYEIKSRQDNAYRAVRAIDTDMAGGFANLQKHLLLVIPAPTPAPAKRRAAAKKEAA